MRVCMYSIPGDVEPAGEGESIVGREESLRPKPHTRRTDTQRTGRLHCSWGGGRDQGVYMCVGVGASVSVSESVGWKVPRRHAVLCAFSIHANSRKPTTYCTLCDQYAHTRK